MSDNIILTDREKDILKLCEAILNTSAFSWSNPNGADEHTCPFCGSTKYAGWAHNIELSEIKHELNCAYLIAKDLSTNLLF